MEEIKMRIAQDERILEIEMEQNEGDYGDDWETRLDEKTNQGIDELRGK